MLRKLLLFFILFFSVPSFADCHVPFSQLVIFGDSYSDNGNTFQASKYTYPGQAYSLGRFSDGPTWSEYLAMKLGMDPMNPKQFSNFAFGQAQILGKVTLKTHSNAYPKKSWKFTVPDLKGEISLYQKSSSFYPKKALIIIFIGTNDFLNYVPNSKDPKIFIKKRVEVLNKQVQRLIQMGVKRIVILNMRDLKRSPLARQLALQYRKHYLSHLDKMILLFNKLLAGSYIHNPKVKIFNTYQFDKKIFSSKTKYRWYRQSHAINQKRKACYVNKGNYVDVVGATCQQPWSYFFYDRIHPTTYVHKLMSDQVAYFIK